VWSTQRLLLCPQEASERKVSGKKGKGKKEEESAPE
jgi:hypothetical protein